MAEQEQEPASEYKKGEQVYDLIAATCRAEMAEVAIRAFEAAISPLLPLVDTQAHASLYTTAQQLTAARNEQSDALIQRMQAEEQERAEMRALLERAAHLLERAGPRAATYDAICDWLAAHPAQMDTGKEQSNAES